eukprot:317009-Prorocentrum_minimum.AAC.3
MFSCSDTFGGVGMQIVKGKSEIEELKEANKTLQANAKRDIMVLEVWARDMEAILDQFAHTHTHLGSSCLNPNALIQP